LQKALRRAEALYAAARALSQFDNLPRILEVVVDGVAEALPANAVSLITIDREERRVVHFVKGGEGAAYVDVVPYDELQSGLMGWALRGNQPVLSSKEFPDPREGKKAQQRRRERGTGSIMVAPLAYRERILGAVTAMNRQDDLDFTAEDLTLLAAMADQATAAIENGRLFMEIQTHLQELERKNAELLRLSQLQDELLVAYGRFVPREFLSLLHKESILDAHLGDQVERDMTILFADVRDFTPLAENMTPGETFEFVNELLGVVGPAIRQRNGFIDKYTGDGIMALFPETAADAVNAALTIQDNLRQYNQTRLSKNQPPIRLGIGVHTGRLTLGTVGEAKRMDTTVIGDAVNIASRMEYLTKQYPADIIISDRVYQTLEQVGGYDCRFLGSAQVKGRSRPVEVYEALSPPLLS
jgi:class 3 adenylate cyclase